MINPIEIEASFKQFMSNLPKCAHDGVVEIDLKFLHEHNILNALQDEKDDSDDLTQYFHVIESVEKVTLFNDQFSIWIVPRVEDENGHTLVLIAINRQEKPKLESVFVTRGVYNTPKHVLKVLQHYLLDMQETEKMITLLQKSV